MGNDDVEARSFQTTHWSLVARAGAAASEEQRTALGQLLERYSPALRAHLMSRKGMSIHDAEDLLQAFVAGKILEQALVGEAAPERGRFRTFVLTSLDRFAVSHFRHQRALKRFAGATVAADADLDVAAPTPPPEDRFDVEWARNVLQEALRRMRAECEQTRRTDVWDLFDARIVLPMLDQREPPPYDELVRRFGFVSPAQASNLLVTAKRMLVRVIRNIIGEYELGEERIDAEIADLKSLLSRSRH